MFHTSPDFSVVTTNWRTRPPTGPELRRALTRLLPDGDFQDMLSREMNRSATYVEWCLKSEAIVPACLLAAALRLINHRQAQPVDRSMRRAAGVI